jgi:hypothetical protein
MALGTGSNAREGEAAGGAPKLHHHQAAFGCGLLGLAAASTAITMAVSEPPPWLDRNTYFVALSGAFFAGTTLVIVSVSAVGGRRDGAGRKKLVMYASLVVAASLTAAWLLL